MLFSHSDGDSIRITGSGGGDGKHSLSNYRQCSVKEKKVETAWATLLDKHEHSTIWSLNRSEDIPPAYQAHLLASVLSRRECSRLVAASESEPYGYGRTDYPQSYRGNLRLITTDNSLADALWARIRPFVPATITVPAAANHAGGKDEGETAAEGEAWEAVGLNECFRLAKYLCGDRFQPHLDAAFHRTDDERSMFTVNVYLNDVRVQAGGRTRFYDLRGGARRDTMRVDFAVAPAAGRCLVFRQPGADVGGACYTHDGEELLEADAVKYLLRTDVMYRRRGGGREGVAIRSSGNSSNSSSSGDSSGDSIGQGDSNKRRCVRFSGQVPTKERGSTLPPSSAAMSVPAQAAPAPALRVPASLAKFLTPLASQLVMHGQDCLDDADATRIARWLLAKAGGAGEVKELLADANYLRARLCDAINN